MPDNTPDLRDATVLVVDDLPENLEVVGGLLQGHYRVKVANSGARCLRAAIADPIPDLILLDVMMPGMDGLTVGKTLAADPVLSRIPVVMLSALGAQGDVQAGMASGVQAYLVKPFSPKQLLSLVQQLIEAAKAGA